MVSLQAVEFGRIFGFSTGLDGPTPDLPSTLQLQEYRNNLATTADADTESFWSEVSAQYLPCMLKTAIEAPLSDSFYTQVVSLAKYLSLRPDASYERRFVREHPDDVLAFHLFIREVIYKLPNHLYEPDCGDLVLVPLVLHSFVMSLYFSYTPLASSYPGSFIPLPNEHAQPSSQQIATIRRLVKTVLASPGLKFSPHDLKSLPLLPDRIARMASLNPEKDREERRPVAWEACEWAGMEERAGRSVECVRLPEGEQMMACGRCVTVRYCSREHQRLG